MTYTATVRILVVTLIVLAIGCYLIVSQFGSALLINSAAWRIIKGESSSISTVPQSNQFIVINAGKKTISRLNVRFLNEEICINNLPGGHAVRRIDVSNDMSGRFKLHLEVRHEDGGSVQREYSFRRPKNRPVLQMSIKDNGEASFR